MRHTGPIIVPVPVPSPTQPGPEKIIVVQPPIQQGTRDEPETTSPPVLPRREKERAGYSPRAGGDTRPSEPLERAPVSTKSDTPASTAPEVKPVDKEKPYQGEKKKINEPLKISHPEPASQTGPRKKLQHKKRERGRQRKYHQTIALLEDFHDGDTEQFDKLDPQMQRYYKREYPEYFGRESKRSAEQRLTNRTKAQRTKRESERRRIAEISRTHAAL